MAKKRANTRASGRFSNTHPTGNGRFQKFAATRRAIKVVPYRKPKTGSGYDSPTAHGDVTNLAFFAKNRKSPFFDVIISVIFYHIRFMLGGQ